MAELDTASRAELIVKDGDGVQQEIVPFSITVTGDSDCISWSNIYGNGQIDVIGVSAGTAAIHVSLPAGAGDLEVTVSEAETGPGETPTLIVTLGPLRPKS